MALVDFIEKEENEFCQMFWHDSRATYLGIPTYNLIDGSKIVQRMLILLSRGLG